MTRDQLYVARDREALRRAFSGPETRSLQALKAVRLDLQRAIEPGLGKGDSAAVLLGRAAVLYLTVNGWNVVQPHP